MQSGPQRDLGMEKTDNGKSDWETGQAGAQCHSWEPTTQRHGDGKASAHNLAPSKRGTLPWDRFAPNSGKHCRNDSEESFNFTKALMEMFICEHKQESFLIRT